MDLCVRSIDCFPSFYVFFLLSLELFRVCAVFFCWVWNCSESVRFFSVEFGIVPRVCGFFLLSLELFRECPVFFLLSLELFRECAGFFCWVWNCSESVRFFSVEFGTVPRVYAFFLLSLELFRECAVFFFILLLFVKEIFKVHHFKIQIFSTKRY
jgi:hypothetical protein